MCEIIIIFIIIFNFCNLYLMIFPCYLHCLSYFTSLCQTKYSIREYNIWHCDGTLVSFSMTCNIVLYRISFIANCHSLLSCRSAWRRLLRCAIFLHSLSVSKVQWKTPRYKYNVVCWLVVLSNETPGVCVFPPPVLVMFPPPRHHTEAHTALQVAGSASPSQRWRQVSRWITPAPSLRFLLTLCCCCCCCCCCCAMLSLYWPVPQRRRRP